MRKRIKDFLCSSRLGLWLYTYLYLTPIQKYCRYKGCRQLRRYGVNILRCITNILDEEKIPYFLDYGTLLGCVRERSFIRHDDDIDFGILATFEDIGRLTTSLIDGGFRYVRAFVFDGKVTEITFERNGILIDFFFHFEENDKLWAQCYNTEVWVAKHNCKRVVSYVVRTYRPLIKKLIPFSFYNISTFIPENYEDVLCAHYGRNWKISNASWDRSGEGDYCIKKRIKNDIAYVVGLTEMMKVVNENSFR